jgi:hypothetical protein
MFLSKGLAMLKKTLVLLLPVLALAGSAHAQSRQPASPGVGGGSFTVPAPQPVAPVPNGGTFNQLNPQPEPPGVGEKRNLAIKPTWSAGSDSSPEAREKRNLTDKPTWSAGSDSSEISEKKAK